MNVRSIFLLLNIFLAALNAQGQGKIKIKGCIKDLPYKKIYLDEIVGGQHTHIDSAIATNGCFDFYVSDSVPAGMYSVILNKEKNAFIRILINNREDVIFYTEFNKLLDSMRFVGEGENTIYYSYLKKSAQVNEKNNLLKRMIALSSDNPVFLKSLQQELTANANAGDRFGEGLIRKHPNSMAAAFIRSLIPVQNMPNNDEYRMEHFLDSVDFGNMALHRSDVLVSAILNFLRYTESRPNTFTEQVELYAQALDKILLDASKNELIYNYYRRELTSRYMYGNFDIIGSYLDKYYGQIPRALPQGVREIRDRLSKLVSVNKGKKAPSIAMPAYDGKVFTLEQIPNEYTLLVFWSTTCSHCTETLPLLKTIYGRQQQSNLMEVLAVSFDTEMNAWQEFLKKGNYSWLNYSDFKGWNSDIARNYNIKGTPTYLLLDKNKMVLSKPATLEELVHDLRALKIIDESAFSK